MDTTTPFSIVHCNAAECACIRQQLQQAYQQMADELELARRIQTTLQPRSLPELSPVHFAVRCRPSGHAGGDCYDVVRLDEDRVGFYVADVVGHGVPAGLLTLFLKNALRLQQITGQGTGLLRPHEVLEAFNRDILNLALTDDPFISMVYALFDRRDGTVAFARAGHPHPILVPRGGEPKICRCEGTLLGLFETTFTTQTLQLRPGDKLLLHTDGLDSLSSGDRPCGSAQVLALAKRFSSQPIAELVNQVAQEVLEQTAQLDDFTLLGLELCAS
jgi:sigma-B regulation protein RsbU (phosphoserine phosphatase)